jgi:ABC-type lipoprotein export system ATPase subunit
MPSKPGALCWAFTNSPIEITTNEFSAACHCFNQVSGRDSSSADSGRGKDVGQAPSNHAITPSLVEIENLVFYYPSRNTEPEDTTWHLKVDHLNIPARTICRVLGDNMTGKTTLLRILAGLEQIKVSPQTKVSGSLVGGCGQLHSYTQLRLRDTCFLSHSDRMFPDLTIWQNVLVAKNCGPKIRRSIARARFHVFTTETPYLKENHTKVFGDLSSGGKALVRLARAYTWRSRLILVDEVTAHLDPNNANQFFARLGARPRFSI